MGITVSLHIPLGKQEKQIYSGDLIRFHVINLDFCPAVIILNWIENLWNIKYNVDKLHWSGKNWNYSFIWTHSTIPTPLMEQIREISINLEAFVIFKKNYAAFYCSLIFPGGSAGKESTCNAGGLGSIPGLRRSLGEGKGYPLQYSGLENSMDCIVHGITKSRAWLSNFTYCSLLYTVYCYK